MGFWVRWWVFELSSDVCLFVFKAKALVPNQGRSPGEIKDGRAITCKSTFTLVRVNKI